MFGRLLLLFIGIPLLELTLLVKLGTLIGFWPTMAIVVGTGILGAALAKSQGLRAWLRIQGELQAGRMPVGRMLDGLLILIGGIVLLTPGLLTDLCGFALLVPWTRNGFKRLLRRKLEAKLRSGEVTFTVVGR